MSLYMTQVGYSSGAWAALTQNPENRSCLEEVFHEVGMAPVRYPWPAL